MSTMWRYLSRLPSFKWWVTTLGTLPASAAIGLASYFRYIHYGIAVAVVWTVAVAWINWPGRYNRKALEETLSALPTFLAIPATAHVRCAIYVPMQGAREEWLQCVTNYMPDNTRRFGYQLPASKGIIGLAYRSRETRVELLDDPRYDDRAEFQRYMMHQYGFTETEARELRQDRRAYLASPIVTSGNVVLGVIYLDTDQAAAFRDPALIQRVESLAPFFHQLLSLRGE